MTSEYVKRTASDHMFILYMQFKANKNNIRATTTATEMQGKPRFYYAGVRETLGRVNAGSGKEPERATVPGQKFESTLYMPTRHSSAFTQSILPPQCGKELSPTLRARICKLRYSGMSYGKMLLKYHTLEERYLDILSEPPVNAKSNPSTMLIKSILQLWVLLFWIGLFVFLISIQLKTLGSFNSCNLDIHIWNML
jgi:hypothetical protein